MVTTNQTRCNHGVNKSTAQINSVQNSHLPIKILTEPSCLTINTQLKQKREPVDPHIKILHHASTKLINSDPKFMASPRSKRLIPSPRARISPPNPQTTTLTYLNSRISSSGDQRSNH